MRQALSAILLLATLTSAASADELILTNGDRIQGQEGDQSNGSLTWHSDSFGSLTIPLDKVATINGSPITITESAPPPAFKNTYAGTVSATGAYASGNEEREDWDIEGSVEWREGDFRHHSGINYESHSLDNSPANEEYLLDYGIDWFFQDKWYWNNGLLWGANDNRAIDQYYALGSAVGRQFWDQESGALSAETGLLWISEEFEDQSTDNRLTWSWAADYRQMITPSLELFHSHSLRVSLSDLNDSELRADLGLKAPLIEDIFTELKLEWIYDNQPVEGTDPSDTQLTIGVSYSW
jgi:putative salt-induced outer membrane protein YdiY